MRAAEVIVGIDPSPESRLALCWATTEAKRRGCRLRIVHGVRSHWPDSALSPQHAHLAARHQAPKIVDAARADVREWAPGVEVDAQTESGSGAAVLIAAARPGDLVVVGSRGHSEFTALLAGSTCQQVAMHAPTSVVVVRGRPGSAPGQGVVAGFDGSSDDVLAVAFEQADALRCPLTVLRAFRPSTPAWPADAPPPDVLNATTAQAALLVDLQAIVLPLVEKYPAVRVEVQIAGGNPAQLLVEASRDARLVVVGSRGHGGFAGLLLGSVGLHLVHHSHCPVLLARA